MPPNKPDDDLKSQAQFVRQAQVRDRVLRSDHKLIRNNLWQIPVAKSHEAIREVKHIIRVTRTYDNRIEIKSSGIKLGRGHWGFNPVQSSA